MIYRAIPISSTKSSTKIFKLQPAGKEDVVDRLLEINGKRNNYEKAIGGMHEFFRMCYCDEVLKYLLAARSNLDWEKNIVDATLMSIILISYLQNLVKDCQIK